MSVCLSVCLSIHPSLARVVFNVHEQFREIPSPYPTSPFPIIELQNPWIDEFYVVGERRRWLFKLQNCERARRVNDGGTWHYCMYSESNKLKACNKLDCDLAKAKIKYEKSESVPLFPNSSLLYSFFLHAVAAALNFYYCRKHHHWWKRH